MNFFFYDLETSGVNSREARIMQFGGIRTDMNLEPIEEPHNYLLRLTEDIMPDPDAVLITGITPQATLADGISEPAFLKIFHEKIATMGTIFVGFNSVRFDDEFMRFLHYRNFYDAYEWQWKDGRSRWDLLDLVRMTRALRPEGIKWPVDSQGVAANRLELLTKVNKIEHTEAHDALSDVKATIALAQLIKKKQPKLFDYLLTLRDKKKLAVFVKSGQPFLYTSGKYPSEFEKTTAVGVLADHPKRAGVLVFDLRHDPDEFAEYSPELLAEAWRRRFDDPGVKLPVKTLQFNRCPAVAPLSVLDNASAKRLKLDTKKINQNFDKLKAGKLTENILKALELLEGQQQATIVEDDDNVDSRLYDGFVGDGDKAAMSVVRAADQDELRSLEVDFKDQRLAALLPLYKARHFPSTLTDEERAAWERFKHRKLMGGKQASRLAKYFERLAELAKDKGLSDKKRYLLEELQLWGQSIMPDEL